MRLHLDTSHESDWARGQWRQIAAGWEKSGHLAMADSPDRADAILVTVADPREAYGGVIRSIAASGPYREHPDRTFVFDTQDSPVGYFPGLYCSLRRYLFSRSRHRTGCYMQSFNEHIRFADPADSGEPRWLFSFQGNLTSKTRARLFATTWGRDDVLIERTEAFWTDTGGARFRHFKQQYADNIVASRFVLCPRGIGTSTFRLFETLQSGRVPVILSDSWVPCAGVNWDDVALRVRERDVGRLPEICLANGPRWEAMARAARRVWEEWFSPVGMARLVGRSIEEILRERRFGERCYRADWPIRSAAVNLRSGLVATLSKLRR